MSQSNPFQSVVGLGALKSVHGFSRFFRNNRFALSGVILVGIFSCMCLMIYGLMQDAQHGIQNEGIGTTLALAAFFILLWLFIIVWMMWDWLRNRTYAAALFDGGVAIHDQKGQIQSVSWEGIEYMQAHRLRRTPFHNYNLVTRDGRVLVLYHFLEEQARLVQSVKQALSQQE